MRTVLRCCMPRFYFSFREEDRFFKDREGDELADIEAARIEAMQILAEAVRDRLCRDLRKELAIEVTDEDRRPVLVAKMSFGITRAQPLRAAQSFKG
jgi:hypothetical protein